MNRDKNYDDIINLPYPYPSNHQPMPRAKRAAQFAPFAALSGHEDAIHEVERITTPRVELTNEEKEIISNKLNFILSRLDENPLVTVTHFRPDRTKVGGEYITSTGHIKKYDDYLKVLTLDNSITLNVDDIVSLFVKF